MEVIVNDTVYRVTKEGTFYTNIQNINELEYAIEHIDLFSNISNKLKKYKDIYLYDSHNLWNTHEDNPITNANYFDDPDDELYGEEDDIEDDVIQTRSVHRNITDEDFESFPTMGIVKAKILGKVLELVFNKTSYNKYRFKSNRRRKLYVSFYNKDYVFYRSGGFDVKVMKKLWHGGWGRMKTWSCGVYTGFSQIRIKHTLSNFMSSELNSFVKNIHEEQKKHINDLIHADEYYKLHKNEAVFYDNYPFRNEFGNKGFSIPFLVDLLDNNNVAKLNKELTRQLIYALKHGFKYNPYEPVTQFTAFNTRNPQEIYSIYTNILRHNGGGYRIKKQFLKEYKTIVLGLGIKGGRNYKYDLKIGTHDIIKSEVVAVDGYIYIPKTGMDLSG